VCLSVRKTRFKNIFENKNGKTRSALSIGCSLPEPPRGASVSHRPRDRKRVWTGCVDGLCGRVWTGCVEVCGRAVWNEAGPEGDVTGGKAAAWQGAQSGPVYHTASRNRQSVWTVCVDGVCGSVWTGCVEVCGQAVWNGRESHRRRRHKKRVRGRLCALVYEKRV